MASLIYNSAIDHVVRGAISFEDDDFRVMLCTSRYSPDKNHVARAEVMGCEVVGEGYGAGGIPVSVAIVPDKEKQGTAVWLGGASWLNATLKARYAVYYRRVGGGLVACIDFGEDVRAVKGAFTLTASEICFGYAS